MIRTFNFSRNWNNKLDCNQFSTIRLRNDYANVLEDVVVCKLTDKKDKRNFRAIIKYIFHFRLKDMTDAMARLDMDLPLSKAKTVLYRMYGKKVKDLNIQQFSFMVLKKIKS